MSKVKIWDLYIRCYHGALIVLIAGLWWTAENYYMDWHLRLALVMGGLLLTRIIWGVVGSPTARFSHFVRGPRAVLRHLYDVIKGRPALGTSHTAAGGWAVMLMLSLLAIQFTTGLFATDDIFFSGPLAYLVSNDTSSWLTSIHKLNFNIVLGVIAVHIVAITIYRLRGVKLVASMIHGYRTFNATKKVIDPSPQSLVRNGLWAWLLAVIIITALYWWIVF